MREPDYERDGITLYCGDCLEILPQLEPGSADALITDPPYSSGGMVRSDRMQSTLTKYQSSNVATEHPTFSGDNRDQRGFMAWCSVWLMFCETVVKPGGAVCLFTDWRQLPTTSDAIQSGGFVWRGIVVWDKQNARPMPDRFDSRCEYVVWGTRGPREFVLSKDSAYLKGHVSCGAPPISEREHSTQKPIPVMEHLIGIVKQGQCVLDPFMGSGTTGVACVRTGRSFVGIEKSREIFDIAVKRIDAAIDADRDSLWTAKELAKETQPVLFSE